MIGPVTRYDGSVTARAGGGPMAGPKDRVLEQQQGPDSVRTRESDPVGADLRQRLERLPPGHPSSPYNDDGSRKPPVPDPFEHDYPIPGDPDYRPVTPSTPEVHGPTEDSSNRPDDPLDAVDRSVAGKEFTADSEADHSLYAERTPPSGRGGSWEWKGTPLTPDRSRLADQTLARCREVEGRDESGRYEQHGLTPAMRRIEAQLDHGRLAPDTEKFALKSADRLKEKFAKLIQRYPGENPEKLVNEIHDGIRYTFLSDAADYVVAVWEATDELQRQGFELIARTNKWSDAEYKGVNTRWRDPESGLLFEVQLHTSESWDAKQRTHEAYEKINDAGTPVKEVERLRRYQQEVSAHVPLPANWQSIPDYRKENM
jgi:hypothetical protein